MLNSLLAGLCSHGDRSLLALPRRTLLISRTPRRPAPDTPWVRAVVEAVRHSLSAGETIVTGVGRDPYELALREAQRQRGAAIVVLVEPPGPNADETWGKLLPERHLLVWNEPDRSPATSSRRRHDEARLRARDLLIGRLADRAWDISIRRRGIMAALAEDFRQRGCPVEKGLRGARSGERKPRAESKEPGAKSKEPGAKSKEPGARSWPYLSHYTREPDGAWPGETRGAYLDWLATGPLGERRDAFAALRRILVEERIRGSGRLMPNREPMVSFTAAPPADIVQLRRFRASLHRWDFRPYGLAIRRDALERLGARPVHYLPEAELKRLATDARRFAQKHEPPKTDWSREVEWRLPGDLRLT